MKKTPHTPISKIGEFKLIEKITQGIKTKHKSTKIGVGDDAAVVNFIKGTDHLISTDMLVENVHFNSNYCPLKHIGYKAMVVNISDICAMNGNATHALVSLAIPNKYSVELITELYEGIRLACNNYNIDLIGGDTTASSSGLVINVTILGKCKSNKTTYRSGAKLGDLLVVSGGLGAAYLGLQILERENIIFQENQKSQPNLENYPHVLEKQLKPEPRVDIVSTLDKLSIQPSSMIDISDGLTAESGHLLNNSSFGIKIFEDKIPISEEVKKVAKELNIDPTTCALYGGEDYELLFTVPISEHDKVFKQPDLTILGHITGSKGQLELVTKSNEKITLNEDGWDSFLKEVK